MAIEHQDPEPQSGAGSAGCIIFGVLVLALFVLPFWEYITFLFQYACGPKSFG